MKRWLVSPPPDMRAALFDWAVEHEIEVD